MSQSEDKTEKRPVVTKGEEHQLVGFEESKYSKTWQSPFFFIQAADTQLGMIGTWGDGTIAQQYPNVTWEEEIILCRQSVKVINAMRPRPAFFIICGDLVDAFPDKWPDKRREQEKDFFEIYNELDPEIPLVCVCGNHDVGNRPTKDTIENYKSTFGDDYFSFWFGGVHFIVLNSQLYEDYSLVEDHAVAQDKWLDEELEKSAKHKVIFQHIPWFLKTPDEPKEYFNIDIELRKRMLAKFKSSNVSKIFCGHYHRNAGGWDGPSLELVVTSAIGCQIGDDPHGMRIVKVFEDHIEHKYHSLEDCPTDIKLKT